MGHSTLLATGPESTLSLTYRVRGMVTLLALGLSMASSPIMPAASYQETVGPLGVACLSRLHVDKLQQDPWTVRCCPIWPEPGCLSQDSVP